MNQEKEFHTVAQALIFRGKVSLLQLKRHVENAFDKQIKCFPSADNLTDKPIIAESKTPLLNDISNKQEMNKNRVFVPH